MGFLKKEKQLTSKTDKAVVLFNTVKNGIIAEKVLLKNEYNAKKVAPPPEYRKGCEISVEINLSKQKEIEKLLIKHGVKHQGIIPL